MLVTQRLHRNPERLRHIPHRKAPDCENDVFSYLSCRTTECVKTSFHLFVIPNEREGFRIFAHIENANFPAFDMAEQRLNGAAHNYGNENCSYSSPGDRSRERPVFPHLVRPATVDFT